jgi:hypothetical protein
MINPHTKLALLQLLPTLTEEAQQRVYLTILGEAHDQTAEKPQVEQPKLYDLVLIDISKTLEPNFYLKICAKKAIRAANPELGLKEAIDLVDTFCNVTYCNVTYNFHPIILRGVTSEKANEAYIRFNNNSNGNAKAEIVESKG